MSGRLFSGLLGFGPDEPLGRGPDDDGRRSSDAGSLIVMLGVRSALPPFATSGSCVSSGIAPAWITFAGPAGSAAAGAAAGVRPMNHHAPAPPPTSSTRTTAMIAPLPPPLGSSSLELD